MNIFSKKYCAEELSDLERDISEAMDERFTPAIKDIPVDGHCFMKGEFVVSIRWEAGDDTIKEHCEACEHMYMDDGIFLMCRDVNDNPNHGKHCDDIVECKRLTE